MRSCSNAAITTLVIVRPLRSASRLTRSFRYRGITNVIVTGSLSFWYFAGILLETLLYGIGKVYTPPSVGCLGRLLPILSLPPDCHCISIYLVILFSLLYLVWDVCGYARSRSLRARLTRYARLTRLRRKLRVNPQTSHPRRSTPRYDLQRLGADADSRVRFQR